MLFPFFFFSPLPVLCAAYIIQNIAYVVEKLGWGRVQAIESGVE